MKLPYIANIRLPTEKAHGVQIMEMANAFSEEGIDLELIVPKRNNFIKEDPFAYYQIPKTFHITYLPSLDLVHFGRIGFLVQSFTFAISVLWYARKRHTLIYSRDEFFLFLLSFFDMPYIFEVHSAKWHVLMRRAIRRSRMIISISSGLKNFYLQHGVLDSQIVVAPDGVNLARFDILENKHECRVKLSLPQDKKLALYAGHLYARKGAHVLAEAAKYLPSDVLCVFVGGTASDIEKFLQRYGAVENILIVGHKPHQDIPCYLHGADVLVLPNSAEDADSRLYTSPMKLFEYMASGTPVIASDVPSLREVLTSENVSFVPPDDAVLLAKSIEKLLGDETFAHEIALHARGDVVAYSWNERARKILAYV